MSNLTRTEKQNQNKMLTEMEKRYINQLTILCI